MHCGSLKYHAVDSSISHDLSKMANEETRDDSEQQFNTHTDPALIGLNGASEIETIVLAASEGKEQLFKGVTSFRSCHNHFGLFFLTLAVRTTVVPIRILIRTTGITNTLCYVYNYDGYRLASIN